MPVISCPHCGTNLNAPESVLGREVVCGQCKQRFIAAAVGQAETQPQPPLPESPAPTGPEAGEPRETPDTGMGPTGFGTPPSGGSEPDASIPQPGSQGEQQPSDAPTPSMPTDASVGGGFGPGPGPAGFAAGPQTPPPPGEFAPPPPPPPPGEFAPPPYGAPSGQYPGTPLPPSGGATASMVLGIISIVTSCCCFVGLICGIIAIIMGNTAMKKIETGQADPNDRGKANAGRICGIIGLILSILVVILNLIRLATGSAQWQFNSSF